MLEPGFLAKIAGTSAITTIVADRVYPQYARQADKVYPLLVYKIENVQPFMTAGGPSGVENADLVIACCGIKQADADATAAAVQLALNGSRGAWGTLTVQGCILKEDGVNDDVVTQPDSEEIIAYVKEVNFTVTYVKP